MRVGAPELDGFRLFEPIAQGGLSTVWRARHASGIPAAVKVLRGLGGAEEAERFRGEIRAVAAMSHPGIVRVLDLGHAPADLVLPAGPRVRKGAPWLAMEYVGGGTLTAARIPDWESLSSVARSVLEALAHAHARGVIHRDLKPQNLLLVDPRDPRAGLKLADFGIAWTRADAEEAGPTGTLDYMAPEQIEVQVRRYGPWTDLYGLGCLLFELACGRPPFRDEPDRPLALGHLVSPPPPLAPRFPVPAAFATWLGRVLAKEPHDRFRSAAEAHEALFGAGLRPADGALEGGTGVRLFGLRDVPLVGRSAERAALTDALDAATDGPVTVSLVGPAGAGRSRLLRAVDEELRERGAASSFLVHAGAGGDAVARAIRDRVGATGLAGDELRAQLEWWSGDDVEAGLPQALGLALAPPPGPAVDALARAAVVARWLAALARRRPVAWLVDDAHRDPDAVAVARALLADPSRPAALVVLAVADGEPTTTDLGSPEIPQRSRRLALRPLAREERVLVLARALAVEPALAARIDDETGGHLPAGVGILGDLVARGALVPGVDGLRPEPEPERFLPPDGVAPAAPVAGRRVALEAGPPAVASLLAAAEARLERDGPGAARTALRAAERAFGQVAAPRDPRWALRARVLAARVLADEGRCDAALGALDGIPSSLRAPGAAAERRAADVLRAECLAELGHLDEAIERFLLFEAEVGLDDPLRLRVRDGLCRLHLRRGLLDEAEAWSTRADALGGGADDEALAGAGLVRRAGIALRRGGLDAAQELLDRAAPLVEQSGTLRQRSDLAREQAALCLRRGDPAAAERLLARSIERARAAGHRPFGAEIALAHCRLDRGRADEAEHIVQASGALALAPAASAVTPACLVLAGCHARRGRWSAFDRALDRAEVGLLARAEPDHAALLDRAGAEAEACGHRSRAERCRRLARSQRERARQGR